MIVSCDAHTTPLPVQGFAHDGNVWRKAEGGPSIAVLYRITLRCVWCGHAVTLRGKRLTRLLDQRPSVTLRELAKLPTAQESRSKSPKIHHG